MLDNDTGEFLAVQAKRYPHAHHLFDDLERECEIISTKYDGFGRLNIVTQGLDAGRRLVVKLIEITLCRRRREK